MLKIDVVFYKQPFGFEPRLNISLDNDFWKPGEKVSEKENAFLESDLSEEEVVKRAVFESYAEGPPWSRWLTFSFSSKVLGGGKERSIGLV